MSKLFIGLDFGQAQEFTALAVLEQATDAVRHYGVRHLKRWPLGTSYPAIIEDTARLVNTLSTRPMIAMDATGVGQPVVRLVRQANLPCALYAITITTSHTVAVGADGPLVPKKDLVSTMQVLLQSRRLKVATTLPEAPLLVSELAALKAKISTRSDDQLADWRQGAHDDLVLAVALAAWLAENRIEPYTGPLVYWPEVRTREEEHGHGSLIRDVLDRMDREEELGYQWWS
jgi:hypothetical protein